MKPNYQLNYADFRKQMYDKKSRELKARRMILALSDYFGKNNLKKLSVLDVGSSTGIIDNILAPSFKKVTGIDIDTKAIDYSKKNFKRKNLFFEQGDAMKLKYKNNSFDIIICTHVYEHVPNAQKLFKQIYRVLKPKGICYLAAINKYWLIEPHYDLPFLSYLPKSLANHYLKLSGKANKYYETPLSYLTLKSLLSNFLIHDYTEKIFANPKKYGYDNQILKNSYFQKISFILSPILKFISPTFFWLLEKPSNG